jgi:hypothetical protein
MVERVNDSAKICNEMKEHSRVLLSDIETAYDDGLDNDKTSRDATVEVEYLCNYLPCVYEKPKASKTLSKCGTVDSKCQQRLLKDQSIDSSVPFDERSRALPLSPSTSIAVSKSESYQDEPRPPPMVIAASTSETEEDEETGGVKSSTKNAGNRSDTDPFAPRIGKTLCWRNVNMTLVSIDTVSKTIIDFMVVFV